jgi:hypothetical protein
MTQDTSHSTIYCLLFNISCPNNTLKNKKCKVLVLKILVAWSDLFVTCWQMILGTNFLLFKSSYVECLPSGKKGLYLSIWVIFELLLNPALETMDAKNALKGLLVWRQHHQIVQSSKRWKAFWILKVLTFASRISTSMNSSLLDLSQI